MEMFAWSWQEMSNSTVLMHPDEILKNLS
uniref:Uncharacterized protein n=1 Tax=Tetranychus urticae TaxID=32264 RepID=T1KK66_TETUR